MSSKGQGVTEFTPFKKFEYILNSKIEPFPKKIQSLIEIWKSVGQYNQQNSDIRYMVQIMDWAKLHTLNIVLTGKWKVFKGDFEASLLAEVEKTQSELMKLNDAFSKRCQKLADVIKNPWDDPILATLLHDSNASIGPKEIEFFCVETAYLVSVRLKKLCESQCEDLALNLVTAFMNCYHLSLTQNFNLNATKTQILFCFDIHVALLYKYNKMSEIVALFKKLSLEEGLHLIRRFARKRIKISKVWKNYPEITFLASQVFVTAAVTKPVEESGEILKDLLDVWISFSVENSMVEKLELSIRRIIQAANAAEHIYICSEIIYDKVGLKIKTFSVELYIRALTTDMNNLESQKTENDLEKVEKTTKRLANGFFNLAEILKDNVQVSRECALTGFSLEPTLERLQKIEDLARASGFNVLDTGQIWECKLHPPVSSSDDVSWVCNSCGKWMCKPNLDLRLTTNFALNEALNFETLDIHPQLCDDLAVVLNGPRYHLLSWLLRWEDLHRLCEMYLNDMERTKNLVTELKFVDIDYSMFATIKREPVDELAGIEKGYEQFLYSDFNEKFVNIIDGAPSTPPELPQPKSDPNTLKSLRMFRHNLKKNRPQVSQPSSESNNLPNCSQNYLPAVNLLSQGGLDHFSRDLIFNQQRLLEYNNPQEYIKNVKLLNDKFGRKYNYLLDNNLPEDVYSDNSRDYNRAIVDVVHDMSSSNSSLSENISEVRDFRKKPGNSLYNSAMYQNAMLTPSGNYLHDLVQQELLRSQSEGNEVNKANFLSQMSKMDQLVSQSRWSKSKNCNNYPRKPYERYGAARAYPPYSQSSRPQNRNQQTKTSFLPHTYRGPPQKSSWNRASTPEEKVEYDEVESEAFLALQRELDYSNKVIQELLADPVEKSSAETCVQNENSSKNANCLPNNETSNNSKDDSIKKVCNQKTAIITTNNDNTKTSLTCRKLEDLQSNKIISAENTLPINSSIEERQLTQPTDEPVIETVLKDVIEQKSSMTLEEIENIVGFGSKEFFRQQASLRVGNKNSLATSSSEKGNLTQNGEEVEKVIEQDMIQDDTTPLIQSKEQTDEFEVIESNINDTEIMTENLEFSRETSHDENEVDSKINEEETKIVRRDVSIILRTALEKKAEGAANEIEDYAPTLEHKAKRVAKVVDIVPTLGNKLKRTLGEMEDGASVLENQVKRTAKEVDSDSLILENKAKQDNNLLLKTLSDQHIPIIVDKSVDTSGKSKRDFDKRSRSKFKEGEFPDVKLPGSDSDEASGDIFDYDAPKPNTYKELKIILYRLTTDMIKSFIPSYTGNSDRCECDKKTGGRPRKYCTCEHRNPNMLQKPLPQNRGFDKIGYNKRKDDRYKRPPTNRSDKTDGDTHKKTGHRKYGDGHLKGDDSAKKPKKDSDDKTFTNRSGNFDENLIRTTMNPRVVLERLPLDTNYVRSVLSNVPGLNDYEMIRPGNVNHIVNVVQISGGRSASNVPVQNTQTSTQITPHIQRIGQPRLDKPEHNVNSETPISSVPTPASTSNTIKPSTSQPSTLINILSQQIIRPGQSNCVRTRSSPLINILSQQIIRPATTQLTNKTTTNSVQSAEQAVTTPKVVSSVEQSSTNEATAVKTVTTTTKSASNPPPGGQGTILQFICKSTLPKFQQAFGKSVYQNNTETTDATSTCTETTSTTVEVNKKSPTKTSPVNIQPIQGGVIYTRQMPVGQTINLIPPGRGQVFRIATSNSDQISLVKDTVIHSKMSALLAAALQGKQKSSETQSDGEATEEASSNRVTVTRPTLVQNARIVKPVLQIPSNVIRTSPQSNLSSTTLEQLREFDMVYKQIKERSSTSTPSEPNTPSDSSETTQRISVTYLNQQGQKYTQLSPVVVVSSYCNLQPAASPALSVTSQGSSSPCVTPAPTPSVPKVSSKGSKGKTVKSTTTQASKASPIPKPQQKPQEDEHTTQRIFDILAEYAEQLRNSPDLNNKPAPRRRSNPPTNPSQNSKRKKSSSSKKSGQCSSMVSEADIEDHRTVGSEDSSCGVVQISVQEDEQQHVQTVTTESNDSSSGSRQQLILTDAGNNQTRNLIIADSSVGEALKMPNTAVLVPGNYIMPVSMVKGGQQIAVVSGGSKILATVPARSGPNMLLFQSFLNQNRKSGVSTVKYSTIQPISGISSQTLAGVSGQPPVILPPNSHNLTAVTLGQPITLKKIDEADNVNTELLLTISQPRDNVNSTTESALHPDTSSNAITSTVGNIELEETIIHSDNSSEKVFHTFQKSIVTAPIATPVIAQASCVKEETTQEHNSAPNSITLNVSENNKSEAKSLERVQSVLVTACTSNGPMLSHTPPRYRKPSDSTSTNNDSSNKEEFLHNGEKQNNNDQKHFQGNTTYFQKNKKTQNPQRLDRELHQLCLQRKQAALERELRLQKSLSEECEDLGVDEPSTSDLFPEADILFDSNHSPSFDQTSQDLIKRVPQDIKEESKSMALFSDDDNSSSLRTDFLFESVEYQTTERDLEYVQSQQLTNGQSSASNESGSSCEDNTLLQNCASMSDVTLNSPVSPDPYNDNMPPTLNKYKFKYSNRRKSERSKQSETWTAEVSSSEDTTGSTELGKSSSHSPESCTNKRSHSISCDDELSDGSYKVVRVAISKSDLLKDEESCEELHCEDHLDCSPSGRGARRSVKKLCSCCNGSQDGGASRKRPASRPHTPAPHKKAFLNKKR